MELHELLDRVEDEATFLTFVRALLSDLQVSGASWENSSLEQFLESALAWAESTNLGATQGLAGGSAWRRAATFLYCGKIYE